MPIGEMGSEGTTKASVVTQVSVGGFGESVTAKELTEFLEEEIGLVWRCRLKTSCTPPGSYPNFDIVDTSRIAKIDDYKTVAPHAFVHFAIPESAAYAMNAAGRCKLTLNGRPLKVSLGPENPYNINQRSRTTMPFKLAGCRVEIGTLVTRDEFLVAWKASGVNFLVDPFDNMCRFSFTKDIAFSLKDTGMHGVIKCDFKMEISVREINVVRQYKQFGSYVVLLQLASSPRVWYRTADDDIYETVPIDLLDDDDPWIRTTDFTPNGAIGRCLSYRVLISPRHEEKLKNALGYLRMGRVQEERVRLPPRIRREPDFMVSKHFFCIEDNEGISFDIMFLVNAVMHRGTVNQFQLTKHFFDLLRQQSKEVNVAALKHLCTYKRPVFDACRRLKRVQEWVVKNPKLLESHTKSDDIVEIRKLAITPTRAYCLPPEVELSNRVLRKYTAICDRFLRVTFMDEGMQTMNSSLLSYYAAPIVKDLISYSVSQKTRVFKRVKTILTKGFYLCGRKYSFLAFSSNQLRDCSAWFFAEDGKTSVLDIKKWMGKFTNKNIAKCAARMGQCFSSTYATVDVMPHEVDDELPDITRNSFVFSDGIGMITPDLADEVIDKLRLDANCPPCAFQIRYAGCKGVVARWPSKGDGIRLSLRPSMNKFHSKHTTLEICSWTKFQPGFLNRQIIILLSTLGVSDNIFWDMQEVMISKLNQMLEDTDVAFEVLTASCAGHGNTAAIMLSAGFKPKTEPHLRGMLSSVRAAQLWGLREKTRIFVPSGRWLMGCLDEAGVLEQGQCFIQISTPSIENCFSKHGSRFSETKKNLHIVTGYVAMAKNPCLHPGDVRILEAVDVPELHHLYDCLVFPQKGERPHTNEASGSDLDGDLYFVTWDLNLIPPSKKSWSPMLYDAVEAKTLTRAVSRQDIIDFFVRNMVNDHLGRICNAHVVHADRSEYGALDEDCILLAELAATAVDFPKTGKIVTMPHHLKPKLYPDFMGKEDYQSYESTKILGRLYRKIKDVYDEDDTVSSEINSDPRDIPYDTDLEISGFADFVPEAWNHKCSYDGQLTGLLGQYKVQKEEEIVTGHIWSMPKYTSRKQGELKERLKHSYTALKKEFRKLFDKTDPEHENLSDEEKNLLYEKKASAWYHVTYHPEWVNKSLKLQQDPGASGNTVMLSFAWIAADYLARIKIRSQGKETFDVGKPVNSLAKYLAERI
ncbi:PREDICTED: RNA-dependent RNA polymerase 6-like [Tarenaya hassleriana]|uniref:RNA-dependent RNA polymerase 6-like n=1 Tax=Tarenaya hassleriana TaxID=28532 RepID=UPI00053C12A6|nr:PREDICTED: RNA-dependent RNA polymerase 6-like [Tarenaya hassleriana]